MGGKVVFEQGVRKFSRLGPAIASVAGAKIYAE